MNSLGGNDSPVTRNTRKRSLSKTDFSQGQDGELFASEKSSGSERIQGAMGPTDKKDISAIHTKHMPEEPLRFQIPRKNKEKQALFQSVPLESREFENLLTILSSNYRDAASSGSFTYTKPRLVHSELLEKEFVEKRREMKQDGRTEKELEETHCFLLSDTIKLPWTCDKGLCVGHSWITALGNPDKGVYLSKYSDLLQINPFSPGSTGEVIIFKVMKGKVKSIYENMSKSLLDPTPRFDCHFSKNASKVTSLTSYRAYELTQQYFYEYSFDELRPRPRQVCPLAVLTFHFKGKDTPMTPLRINSQSSDSGGGNCHCPVERRHYVVWSGELTHRDTVLCRVCLHSFSPPFLPFKLPEKQDVGWAMRFGQVTRLLPSTLFSWNLYAGSHEVLKNGHYCSLLEVEERSRTGDRLNKLLQGLEDNQVVLVNLLTDGGLLLLLSSAQMATPSERGDGWKRCLHALFIFPEARDVTKYVSRCPPSQDPSDPLTAPPPVMPQLQRFVPALHHALLKVRGNPPSDLSAAVERQAQEYLRGQRDSQVHRHLLEGYDSKLDDRGRLFPAPKQQKLNMEGYLRSYLYGPSLYLLPASKARDMVQLHCKAPEEDEDPGRTAGQARRERPLLGRESRRNGMGLEVLPTKAHTNPQKVQELLSLVMTCKRNAEAELQRQEEERKQGGGENRRGQKRRWEQETAERTLKYLKKVSGESGERGVPVVAEDVCSPAPQSSLASVIGSLGLKDVDLRRDGSEAAAQLLRLLTGLKQSAMGGANQCVGEEEAGQSESWEFDRLADRLGLPPNRDIDLRKRSLSAEDELEEQMSGSTSSLEGFSPSSHSGDQPRSRKAAGGERRGLAVRGEERGVEEIPWVLIPITGLRSEKYSLRERDNPQDPRFVQETMATSGHHGYPRSPTPSPVPSPAPSLEGEQEDWSPTHTHQLVDKVTRDLGPSSHHNVLTGEKEMKSSAGQSSSTSLPPSHPPQPLLPPSRSLLLSPTDPQTSSYPDRSSTPSPEPSDEEKEEEEESLKEKQGIKRHVEALKQEEQKSVETLKEGEWFESKRKRVDSVKGQRVGGIQTDGSACTAPTPPVQQRVPVRDLDSIVREQVEDFSSEMQLLLRGESVHLNSPSLASHTHTRQPHTPPIQTLQSHTHPLHTLQPCFTPFSEYVSFYSSSLPVLDYVNSLSENISSLLHWQQVNRGDAVTDTASSHAQSPSKHLFSHSTNSRGSLSENLPVAGSGTHPNPLCSSSPGLLTTPPPPADLRPPHQSSSRGRGRDGGGSDQAGTHVREEPFRRSRDVTTPGRGEAEPSALGQPVTEPGSGAHPRAISSLISQLHPEVFSSLQEIMKDVQKNSVHFYIHSMEREDQVHDDIKEYLRRLGNVEVSPMGFLDKEGSMDKLLIIIQNKDIAEHIHKVPNLVSLKRRPSVVFAGVDSLEDIRNNTYNELFTSGGFIVSDEFVLNPDFITHERLRALLMFLEQQSSADSRWRWRIHLKTMKKLKELARFKREAVSLLSVLSCYQERGVLEVLPYHQCDLPGRPAPDLACLIRLQAHCIQNRHVIFLTERRFEMFPNYSSSGIVIANIDDVMHHFTDLIGFYAIRDKRPITLDPSAVKDLDGQPMEEEQSPGTDSEHHTSLQPSPGLPQTLAPPDQLVPDPNPPRPSGSSSSSLPSTEGGVAGEVAATALEPDFEALRLAISQFKADRRARGLLDPQAVDHRVNPNQSFLPGPGGSSLSPTLPHVVSQPPSSPSRTTTSSRGSEGDQGQGSLLTPSRQALATSLACVHARLGMGLVEPVSDSDMSVDSSVHLPDNSPQSDKPSHAPTPSTDPPNTNNSSSHAPTPSTDLPNNNNSHAPNPSTDCCSTPNGKSEPSGSANEEREVVDRCADFPSSPVLSREGLPDTPESPDPPEHSRRTTTTGPPEGANRDPTVTLNLDHDSPNSGSVDTLTQKQTLLQLQLQQQQLQLQIHQQQLLQQHQQQSQPEQQNPSENVHLAVQHRGDGLLPRPQAFLNSTPSSLGLLTGPPFHHNPMLGALGAIRGLLPGGIGPNMGPLAWAQGLGPAGAAFVWGLQQHHNRDMGGSLMGTYPNQGRRGGFSRGRGGFSSL